MVDAVLRACQRKGVAAEAGLVDEQPLDLGRRPAIALGVVIPTAFTNDLHAPMTAFRLK